MWPHDWRNSKWRRGYYEISRHLDGLNVIYLHWLTMIPAWISNHLLSELWDDITYPFRNFNGCTVEVSEWISNVIPHFTEQVYWLTLIPAWISNHLLSEVWDYITYPFQNFNGCTVEVSECVGYCISHFIIGVMLTKSSVRCCNIHMWTISQEILSLICICKLLI